MSKQELFRRYIVFFLALTIGACGVTLVTRSHLGVNSVACLSYVSSIYLPVTMGTVVIIFNLSMLILQFFLYKRVENYSFYARSRMDDKHGVQNKRFRIFDGRRAFIWFRTLRFKRHWRLGRRLLVGKRPSQPRFRSKSQGMGRNIAPATNNSDTYVYRYGLWWIMPNTAERHWTRIWRNGNRNPVRVKSGCRNNLIAILRALWDYNKWLLNRVTKESPSRGSSSWGAVFFTKL